MASITTFRGRRCTRVRRANSTPVPAATANSVRASQQLASPTVRNSVVANPNVVGTTPIPGLSLASSNPSPSLEGPEIQLPPAQTTAPNNNSPLVPSAADASSKLRSLQPGAAVPTGGGPRPNAGSSSNPTPVPAQGPSSQQPRPIIEPQPAQNAPSTPASPLVYSVLSQNSPAASQQPTLVPEPETPRPAVTASASNGQGPPFLGPGQGGQVQPGQDSSQIRSNTVVPSPVFQTTGLTSGPGPVFTGSPFTPGEMVPSPSLSNGGSLPFTLSFSGPSSTATGLAATASNSSKMVNAGAVAGAVSGIVVLSLISALLFFFCRKRRNDKEQIQESAPAESRGSRVARSVTPLTQHVRALFAKKASQDLSEERPRASTPSLERGNPRMSEVEISHMRASSAPVNNLSDELDTIFGLVRPKEPSQQRGSVPSSHRRSVSSVNGVAYPILSEANNPFRDPDPNATLRIVNPDLSHSGTPTSLKSNPLLHSPPASITTHPIKPNSLWAQPSQAIPPPVRTHQRRNPSINEDPFSDPEQDPFADPPSKKEPDVSPIAEEPPTRTLTQADMPGKRTLHAQPRTLTTVPLLAPPSDLAKTPIQPAHIPQGSADSAYMSSSPQSQSTVRYNPLRSLLDRNSVSSATSSEMSYPTAWGEPGPTRPVSYDRAYSRVSDPFDLDRPEVLGFMKSDMRFSGTTVSRSGSQRSVRYPPSERRKV